MEPVDKRDREVRPGDVSVIVPAHRDGHALERCLAALGRLAPAPREVLIALDGDRAGAVARRVEAAGLQALPSPGRTGPAAARNRGAAAAGGEVLLFLDSDVVAPADLVGRVAAAFRRCPGIVALFGSYDDRPADPGFVSRYKNLLHHHTHQQGREEATTFWAGCGAVRTSAFRAVGGFDPAYRRPSVEDIELGYRLRAAGGGIALVKDLQVTHLKAWTLRSLVKTDVLDRALPWTELILRRGRTEDDLNTDRRSRLSAALAAAGVLGVFAAPVVPEALLLTSAAVGGLVTAGMDFYRLCWRAYGPGFAVGAVLLHWLYLLYGGAAFAGGAVRHGVDRWLGRTS